MDENNVAFDNKTVKCLQEIEHLAEEDKQHVYALLDAFIAKSKFKTLL